jgi:hypothetical protein
MADSLSHWIEPAAVLAKLVQRSWIFEREVPGLASMKGMARFDRQEDYFRYHESGSLVVKGGGHVDVQREYLYAQLPDGFAVHFKEVPPRPFQSVHLSWCGSALCGLAEHECWPDYYHSSYTFEADGTFRISHRVDGPRKNYDIITRFFESNGHLD